MYAVTHTHFHHKLTNSQTHTHTHTHTHTQALEHPWVRDGGVARDLPLEGTVVQV